MRRRADGRGRALILVALIAAAPAARAAGGHHAVDDAALLDPGRCQVETWVDRFRRPAATVFHAGSACRIGAVELGVNLDRVGSAGTTTLVAGPQAKWAMPLTDTVDAGLLVTAGWADRHLGYLGSTIVVPLTWRASDAWSVHLNVGRDLLRNAGDLARAGVALEWTPSDAWTVVGERFKEGGANHWRLGARHAVTPDLAVDLSHARGIGQDTPSRWSVGITWLFER